jgi:hypothetical protein
VSEPVCKRFRGKYFCNLMKCYITIFLEICVAPTVFRNSMLQCLPLMSSSKYVYEIILLLLLLLDINRQEIKKWNYRKQSLQPHATVYFFREYDSVLEKLNCRKCLSGAPCSSVLKTFGTVTVKLSSHSERHPEHKLIQVVFDGTSPVLHYCNFHR